MNRLLCAGNDEGYAKACKHGRKVDQDAHEGVLGGANRNTSGSHWSLLRLPIAVGALANLFVEMSRYL